MNTALEEDSSSGLLYAFTSVNNFLTQSRDETMRCSHFTDWQCYFPVLYKKFQRNLLSYCCYLRLLLHLLYTVLGTVLTEPEKQILWNVLCICSVKLPKLS